MNLCRHLPHRALYSSVLIFTVLISKDVQQTAMLKLTSRSQASPRHVGQLYRLWLEPNFSEQTSDAVDHEKATCSNT